MKVAIVGSREIKTVNVGKYVTEGDEIVSGGAIGVDTCAADYAKRNGLTLTEFLPNYRRYGRGARIVRNKQIVDYAERVVVFWNGSSKGAKTVIEYAEKVGKPCEIVLCK